MKKCYYLFCIILLSLISCNDEAVDNFSGETISSQQAKASKNLFIYDGIFEIRDGKEIDLTFTQQLTKAVDQQFYDIAVIQPQYIFLGSVLTSQSINKGVYAPVGYFNDLKRQITISFSLPVRSKDISPKKSAFVNAISDAIGDKDFSGKQSQVFNYKMKEISTYSELKLAFGANVNVAQIFSINADVSSSKIQKKSALFVDFSQIYFNVSMDIPDDGNIFLNEQIREKYLFRDPVYVNSINYGRKGVILVESDESYRDLSVAIRASFNAKIVNGQLSVDVKTQDILKHSEISICILGGDGEGATKTIKGFEEFQNFIINGGVYTKEVYGVPISFSAGYAFDNSMFVSEFQV